jgi:hypothetical protein
VLPYVRLCVELKHVSTLLHTGRGAILLAGAAGVGKTRLATECLDLATARGFVPLRAPATHGAAGIPFGAFASLVPDLAQSTDLLEVLRKIADAVAGRGKGKPVGRTLHWRSLNRPNAPSMTPAAVTRSRRRERGSWGGPDVMGPQLPWPYRCWTASQAERWLRPASPLVPRWR